MATAKEALAWVDKLHKVLVGRRPEIEKAFGYFQGDQPLAYASAQWKQFHADRYKGFSDNWCGVVGGLPWSAFDRRHPSRGRRGGHRLGREGTVERLEAQRARRTVEARLPRLDDREAFGHPRLG